VNAPVGADDSLELLFSSHYGRLVRALTLVAGDREVAADAVQEAFVKAHLNWWRLKHYDDPIGWIRRVAINRLRDVHRRSVREQRAMDRLTAQAWTSDGGGTVDEITIAEPHDAGLAELVGGLPRQQRLAVTLFYVSELSVAEVAKAMGINEGTVKFHLHQGRKQLRLGMPSDDPGGDHVS
jgi:RNA polymerase sigma-70 factor (ECF subfamily)